MKLWSLLQKQKEVVHADEVEAKDVSSISTSTTEDSYRRSLLITVPVGEVPNRYFKSNAGGTLSPQELMHLNVLVHPALAQQNISLVDALQSGLLIPKGPVTTANLVSSDLGHEPGSDQNSDEKLSSDGRRSSEENPVSGDGPAKEETSSTDGEEELDISPVKVTHEPTPILPELDFVLGPDDFSAILELVDQSKLVLVAEEPGIATSAGTVDDLAQDEAVDLDELYSILPTTPDQDPSASMGDQDQSETPLPESPTIPHAVMLQRFAEPDDCPPIPGPPPSRPPPKEPESPVINHERSTDGNSPLQSPFAGFARNRREAGASHSPNKEYGSLGKREGSELSSQLHSPELPPQVPAGPSTPTRKPLTIPMPTLPAHVRVALSSSESPEPEDSQKSVEDLLAEARRIASDHS
ncbi:hypothetical protein PG993_009489 [Apiospora rasikravindrae]|uniref:Uncharacterized protein n=1 Tax=Apiospora rasikravindrae TaxID=990691 RepID=A0ABR1SJQ5_9PEZI